MTSLSSHHVCITLMMSSHSDHDVIATCMNVGQHKLAALLQLPLPFSACALKKGTSNQEVYLSRQSVNECDSSLLLTIGSHHQQ